MERLVYDETDTDIDAERRRDLIAKTAYRIAERRGFAGGHTQEDWLEAELQVDCQLRQNRARQMHFQNMGHGHQPEA